jgi:hypothetical protein
MTAREAIMEGNEGYRFRDVIDSLDEDIILMCMKEYAKEKCQELLEIVSEKAKTGYKTEYTGGTPNILGSYSKKISTCVDKDSILNAVDLDEFIN